MFPPTPAKFPVIAPPGVLAPTLLLSFFLSFFLSFLPSFSVSSVVNMLRPCLAVYVPGVYPDPVGAAPLLPLC